MPTGWGSAGMTERLDWRAVLVADPNGAGLAAEGLTVLTGVAGQVVDAINRLSGAPWAGPAALVYREYLARLRKAAVDIEYWARECAEVTARASAELAA